eukprot:SAG25_NODE_559_length_6924_cov_15.045421_12_plen_55_part_00
MESLAWAYGEVGYDEQGAEICGAGGESRLNAVATNAANLGLHASRTCPVATQLC